MYLMFSLFSGTVNTTVIEFVVGGVSALTLGAANAGGSKCKHQSIPYITSKHSRDKLTIWIGEGDPPHVSLSIGGDHSPGQISQSTAHTAIVIRVGSQTCYEDVCPSNHSGVNYRGTTVSDSTGHFG